jgi:integrase/recombinase XerD
VAYVDLCVTRSIGLSGQLVPRLGRPELDRYIDFVSGRCRPNTVLATAYDLKGRCCVGRCRRRGGS